MTHLSLFSGIGGIDLAAHWAGFRTVAFVEQNAYCQQVLKKHWPEVPIFDDIKKFEATEFRGVTLVSGGFPCQDISSAGKGAGIIKGKRSALWFDMLRIVRECRPLFVLAENVRSLRTKGADRVLYGLEEAGYTCGAFVVGAGSAGAPHIRYRVFIVGFDAHRFNARSRHWRGRSEDHQERIGAKDEPRWLDELIGIDPSIEIGDLATDSDGLRELQRQGPQPNVGRRPLYGSEAYLPWAVCEPPVPGVVARVPRTVDRIRALGNAVVPQQVYPILKAIADEIRRAA